jgi:hypothetical protein
VFRTLVILGLAATLCGPILRAVEGADDLSRSLAELGQPPLMEEVDGGVGDDSGAAVLKDRGRLPLGPDRSEVASRWSALDRSERLEHKLLFTMVSIEGGVPESKACRTGLRLAWIGRFLF